MARESYLEHYPVTALVTHGWEPYGFINETLSNVLDIAEGTQLEDGTVCNAVTIIQVQCEDRYTAVVVPKYLDKDQVDEEIEQLNKIGRATFMPYDLDE